jgi:hypothetical protein
MMNTPIPTTKNATPSQITKDSVSKFSANDAALVIRNVTTARAIFRAVALAAQAQFDGAVNYADNKADRWHPATSEAEHRLAAVRDVLMQTSDAPDVDWVTALALVEAMGAALWCGGLKDDPLDTVELEALAQVVIEALDSMIDDCAKGGVLELARTASPATLH